MRLPQKSVARSCEVLHLSRKIISANLQIWCSKMQPLSGNQRPDLLTALMNMSLVLRLPRKMHLYRSSSNVPRLPSFLEMPQNPHAFTHFWQRAQSLAPATQNDIWMSKTAPIPPVFTLLTSKCASRHNGVHFFDISTSKSGPNMSEPGVLCTFWLGNVLRATTACTFPTSQLPKVVRTWCVLCILTWKCVSRHNGVQFFISQLASWLRTRRFSEPTFRPCGATNHWKNIVLRDFPTFSRTWTFFLLRLSLLWSSFFFSSFARLLQSLLFICPYCRKFDL